MKNVGGIFFTYNKIIDYFLFTCNKIIILLSFCNYKFFIRTLTTDIATALRFL